MITNVHKSIVKHLRPHIKKGVSSGAYVNGEYVETLSASGVISLASFPLTFQQLRYLPEGAYNTQDRKFFEIGSGSLKKDDIILCDYGTFRINELSDRDFDGGYTVYLSKREAITE